MKLKFLVLFLSLVLYFSVARAQDYESYIIDNINVTTKRIRPSVVKNKFALKENDVFSQSLYLQSQDNLHDLRVFKELEFSLIPKEDNKLDINIDARDGYYIFPLAFYTGGKKSAFALSVAEGNLFKYGETLMLFFASGEDGSNLSGVISLGNHFFQIKYTNLNFTRRFYDNNWTSGFGIFNTSDDEGKFGAPLRELYTKKDHFSFMYGYTLGKILMFISPEFEYIRYNPAADNGSHNKVTAGIAVREGVGQGANMGAMFGYGLSDKKQSLQDLPKPGYGYALAAAYTNGGSWTGADFNISKFTFEAEGAVELKKRHLLNIILKAQSSFNSPVSDEVQSTDLLSGNGRYSRQRQGESGAGLSAAFSYFLLRNNTGLLSLQPFYELAYVYDNDYYHHSGAGATMSYKLWRFPFPVGVNYTRNLSDGSDQFSFVIGGSF
jgi:outer membrane protein assembly factor BamA